MLNLSLEMKTHLKLEDEHFLFEQNKTTRSFSACLPFTNNKRTDKTVAFNHNKSSGKPVHLSLNVVLVSVARKCARIVSIQLRSYTIFEGGRGGGGGGILRASYFVFKLGQYSVIWRSLAL